MLDKKRWPRLLSWLIPFVSHDSAGESPLLLPDSTSPDLNLSHPTEKERSAIWQLTSDSWKDALTVPQFFEESAYLMTIPLAKDGDMTHWVLVDKSRVPDQRLVLASCETFRKRSWISDANGTVTETLAHGIASVYCDPKYRGRGYASRLMRELSTTLPRWQTEGTTKPVAASVLFSDIGKHFYSALGWHPFPSHHIEFDPVKLDHPTAAAPILAEHLSELCEKDEKISRRAMARPCGNEKKMRFMIVPDHDHMLWHHKKEEFVCGKLFGKQPHVKGAVAGQPGNRVWAIWTHRYYGHPDHEPSDNTLYILRLVVENEDLADDTYESGLPVKEMVAVVQAAQAEAMDWNLQIVSLWGASRHVEKLIEETGVNHCRKEREEEGISSLQWYMEGLGNKESLDWIGNEKYGWC